MKNIFIALILFVFFSNCDKKINVNKKKLKTLKQYTQCTEYINYENNIDILSLMNDSISTSVFYLKDSIFNFFEKNTNKDIIFILKIKKYQLLQKITYYQVHNNQVFTVNKNGEIIESQEVYYEPKINLLNNIICVWLCNIVTSDLGIELYFIKSNGYFFLLSIDNASLLDCNVNNTQFPEIFRLLYVLPK